MAECIIKEFPNLDNNNGDGYVEQDFWQLFPEVCDNLFLKCPKIFKEIIAYMPTNKSTGSSYSTLMEPWRQVTRRATLSDFNVAVPTWDETYWKDGKKGLIKHASVVEACDSFVQFDVIGTSLPSFLENTTKKQPFILGLGERENPEQTFEIVERKALPPGRNMLKAVDVCSKLFYLLDIGYPWQPQNVWDFIQKFIFGLGEGKGKQKSLRQVLPSCRIF